MRVKCKQDKRVLNEIKKKLLNTFYLVLKLYGGQNQ